MKKLSFRKLRLERETVRALRSNQLTGVAGGYGSIARMCNTFYCSDLCSDDSRCRCNLTETICRDPCPI